MGVSMGLSSWVEVVWHAGRWHQLGAAAHLLVSFAHSAAAVGARALQQSLAE